MQKHLIAHVPASNYPSKAYLAELFIKIIRQKLRRHFVATGSKRWLSVIQPIVESINNNPRRVTGMLSAHEALKAENKMLLKKRPLMKHKFAYAPGDHVRLVNMDVKLFNKFSPNWKSEKFVVEKLLDNRRVPMYVLSHPTIDVYGAVYGEEIKKYE